MFGTDVVCAAYQAVAIGMEMGCTKKGAFLNAYACSGTAAAYPGTVVVYSRPLMVLLKSVVVLWRCTDLAARTMVQITS